MSLQVKNLETGETILSTKRIHAAQESVINAFLHGTAAVIEMVMPNGKSLTMGKLSEVSL